MCIRTGWLDEGSYESNMFGVVPGRVKGVCGKQRWLSP